MADHDHVEAEEAVDGSGVTRAVDPENPSAEAIEGSELAEASDELLDGKIAEDPPA